jgi:MMP 1-O-methyltransferase
MRSSSKPTHGGPAGGDIIADLSAVTKRIDGWLSPAEGETLFRLARQSVPGTCIVEIGSWKGKSTVWLAAGAKSRVGVRVVAIDPHSGTDIHEAGQTTEHELRESIRRAGVEDQVEVVVATSEDAVQGWNRPVSLLWIDGDHSYEGARRDLELWRDHLIEGGVIAFHDTFVWQGPERLVCQSVLHSGHFSDPGFADTVTFARKTSRPTRRQRLGVWLHTIRRALHGMRLRSGVPKFAYFYLKSLRTRTGPARQVYLAARWLRKQLGLRSPEAHFRTLVPRA